MLLSELIYLSMLSKVDIKKLAKKLWHVQRGKRSYHIMHPERDWLIGVMVAVLLVLGTATWSAVRYVDIRQTISNGVSVEAEGAVVYRESNVATALEIAESRQAVINKFVASQPQPEPEPEVATSTATSSDVVASSTDENLDDSEPLTETE